MATRLLMGGPGEWWESGFYHPVLPRDDAQLAVVNCGLESPQSHACRRSLVGRCRYSNAPRIAATAASSVVQSETEKHGVPFRVRLSRPASTPPGPSSRNTSHF